MNSSIVLLRCASARASGGLAKTESLSRSACVALPPKSKRHHPAGLHAFPFCRCRCRLRVLAPRPLVIPVSLQNPATLFDHGETGQAVCRAGSMVRSLTCVLNRCGVLADGQSLGRSARAIRRTQSPPKMPRTPLGSMDRAGSNAPGMGSSMRTCGRNPRTVPSAKTFTSGMKGKCQPIRAPRSGNP